VYEWIESTFLPSEYAQQSGTVGGNQLGLSGTPKHADDSQYAEVRRYNEARNQYVTQ